MKLGHKRPLKESDLYQVQEEDVSQTLGDAMQRKWNEEIERSKKAGRKPKYYKALLRCFGVQYARVGILAAIEECVLRVVQPLLLGGLIRYYDNRYVVSLTSGIMQPICLGGLIRYFNKEEGYTVIDGWLFSVGVVMGSVLYVFTHHPYFFRVQRSGMQLRVSSCALLYRKALRLSKTALGETTIGQMVNLLSNDVNRFDTSCIFLHYLWIGPLQTLIVVVILWYEIGPSCLAGIFLLILFVPFQSWLGKVFSRLRLATAHLTDDRVRIMNEIVNAMRVIKMYAWEKPFTELVELSRKSEIGVIMKTNYFRAINMSVFFTSSKVIVFLCLLTFILTGNILTAEKVFVTISLINNVRLVMTLFFPFGIAMGSEMLVSCDRLEDFLQMEEREETNSVQRSNLRPKPRDCSLTVTGLTAKWSSATEENTLTNVSCSVKAGELLAVIGPVGAGKGSLLNAILGELPAKSGSIKLQGKIAYASQEPWVFSGTVRQNIVFGQPYHEKKYNEVLRVCALETDLDQFPNRDLTTVGERGMSLSGGQKARVNLARAVYCDADIYLLDDPLSAVDTHVGRHLFDSCIMQHLQHKVRILVTHQLQFLKSASQILVLREGHMEAIGSYHQLVNSGMDFASMLSESQEEVKIPTVLRNTSRGGTVINGAIPKVKLLQDLELASSPPSQFSGRVRNDSISSLHDSVEAENIMTISGAHTTNSSYSVCDDSLPTSPRSPKQHLVGKGDDAEEENDKGQTGSEMRSHGTVKNKVYMQYLRAGSGWCVIIILIILNVLTQILFSGTDYWLSYWTNGEQLRARLAVNMSTGSNGTNYSYTDTPVPEGYLDTVTNVYIYTGMTIGLFVLSMGRTVLFFVVCMASSRQLHNKMFRTVIRVPIQFFDLHPVGQMLNRFTKDLGQIDEMLPITVFDVISIFLHFIGIIGVISYINVWVLLPTVLLGGIFISLRRFYLSTARDVKRLEGITRSPVFSHLSASLQGLTTIRAFQVQQSFIQDFDHHQDLHSSAWFLFLSTTRWFGICLDWISCIYIAVVTFGFMGMKDALGGDIGLAISSAMLLSGMFQWGVRQSAEVENQMTSVERVLEYSSLESEAPLETDKDKTPRADWPERGVITFGDVSLRYNKDDPPVLKNLNFSIKRKEKVGIVGRTGAGKSSLLTSLFRLTEPMGTITIDDININQLGLHDVRKNISIIPQDPTLFSGTMRKNLDPFTQYTDDQLWRALEEVQLKEAICDLEGGLEARISEGGSNLSVGQRQLVCLARAILRHNRILVLDEATANVDPRTDGLIQQTIRSKFQECTVLTIAHRLHTIMDSDRVMVLNAGSLHEFDEPHILLNKENSMFHSLVQQTGRGASEMLHQIAKKAYHERHKDDAPSSTTERQDNVEGDCEKRDNAGDCERRDDTEGDGETRIHKPVT
ncbi:hypothetical protein Pcinc_030600 [Petrolisthes cinctipes]|uniref:Cystic fibrosis transmembrane conductance regulator n=1 Tax=Petrolisthes cinctipes TaxID=88211 RepID=A0AAE1EYE8_PETCI|nr:hypothetical protein Pcinc_030600 [Petrolisthes cinctipes]